jgi:formyltetrahydrofolate hydrolase
LVDLLYRHQSRELACLIPQISSNQADNQAIADFYNIPYVIAAVAKDNQIEARGEQFRH